MVPLAKAHDGFAARVLAARLGSEGIVTQLRGGGIDGPYPVGDVEILVRAPDLDAARELLLADEVESAFAGTASADDDSSAWPDTHIRVEGEGEGGGGDDGRRPLAPWVVLAVVVGLVLFAYVNTIGYPTPSVERDARAPGQEAEETLPR